MAQSHSGCGKRAIRTDQQGQNRAVSCAAAKTGILCTQEGKGSQCRPKRTYSVDICREPVNSRKERPWSEVIAATESMC